MNVVNEKTMTPGRLIWTGIKILFALLMIYHMAYYMAGGA